MSRNFSRWSATAIALLALLAMCDAVDLTGRCVAGPTTGRCANLSPMVYENDTFTSANASALIEIYNTNVLFLSSTCQEAAISFLCASAYKPCIEVNYTDSNSQLAIIGVPARPCSSLCSAAYDACIAALTLAGQQGLVSCSDSDADGPAYPNGTTSYDLTSIGLGSLDVDCNNNLATGAQDNVTCAAPLFVPLPPGAEPTTPYNVTHLIWSYIPQYVNKCSIRCPNPQYSLGYWRSITAMFFSICIISLILGCFTIVTFIFYPDRRKFPSILILHMTVASMIGAFAGTAVYWKGGVEKVLCHSEATWAHWRKPNLCTFQALVFIFGQHAILWWWMVIAANMFVLIIFRVNLKKYYYAIVVAGWLPAFIFMFTAIGLKDTEPGIGWPFCTPASDGILYYPIGVLGSLGILLTLCVVITVKGTPDAKFLKVASRCVRPILFGFICAVPYAVVYAYRFGNKPSEQLKKITPYIQCIVSGVPASQCGTLARTTPAFNYALSFSLSCIGILVWACYSTHFKYLTDFKNWTATRVGDVTGLTTSASKRSSRRDDSWQKASSDMEMKENKEVSRF